jgi:hypothetical protein
VSSPVEARLPRLVDSVKAATDQGIEFYLASNESLLPYLNTKPYGQPLSWIDFTSTAETSWDVPEFLNLFNVINGIAFGDRGIPMPQWVMVDLILMPSAAVMAALPQDRFEAMLDQPPLAHVRDHLLVVWERAKASGYDGPVPVGGYCAAPSAAPGTWVGWSLWSMVVRIGLGRALKALALAAYGTRKLDGVTQYDNTALRVHSQFGPMKILVGTVPFHTSPGSFVYETDLTLPVPAVREPTFLLDPFDYGRQQAMQKRIEAGSAEYYVLPPGYVTRDGTNYVPILECGLNS